MSDAWNIKYPVNFTPGGDETRHAIQKYINEASALYEHLNSLRGQFDGGLRIDDETRTVVVRHSNEIKALEESLRRLKAQAEIKDNKGIPGGYAPLDNNVKVPQYYLPDAPQDVAGDIDGGWANTQFVNSIDGGGA